MSDDDYMSEDFVAQAQTVQPGMSSSRMHKRQLKLDSDREENEVKMRKVPKKGELEKSRLEEGLNKPLCEKSIGFALLSKMGFKPGMSLGKKKDENDLGSGIKEPISIDLKSSRTGLGHDNERKELTRKKVEAEMGRMKQRAENQAELLDEYKKRKVDYRKVKQLIGDIINSRKVCLDMDLRKDLERPVVGWFWKSYRSPGTSTDVDFIRRTEEEEERYTYGNGQEAPEEVRFDQMEEIPLIECLDEITKYLRDEYFYCVWCGCHFTDTVDLNQHCPGGTREQHDEDSMA